MARTDAVADPLRKWFLRGLLAPAAFLGVFFLLPVANMLASSLRWSSFADVLGDSSLRTIVLFTLWQAVLSTVATFAVALPATWALHRWSFPFDGVLRGLLTAPFLMPAVVVATGILSVLPADANRGLHAIVWAHAVFNVAVVVRMVGPRWRAVDTGQEAAASTLGARPARVFLLVVLPQIRGAVLAAASMVFVYCATSFAVVSLVGGPTRRTIETEIFTRAVRLGDMRTAAALAVVQIAVILAVLTLGSGRRTARSVGSASAGTERLSARPRRRWVPPVLAVAASVVVASPLVAVAVRSLRPAGAWSFAAYRTLTDGSLSGIGVDVAASALASFRFAVFACAVAVPMALVMAIAAGRETSERSVVRRGVDAFSSLPVVVSAVTLGFGLIVTFDTDPFAWRSRTWLIPVVHALVALPLAYRTVEPAIRSVGSSLRDAAAVLGASPWRVLTNVDLRLARPAILRATGMVAAISVGEFGATSFLTRRGSATLPIVIGQLLGRPGATMQNSAYALSTLLIIVTAAAGARA